MYTHTHTHTHTHIPLYIYTHTNTHTHVHTCMYPHERPKDRGAAGRFGGKRLAPSPAHPGTL